MATITTYSGALPSLTGKLSRGVILTANSKISDESDIREMFRKVPHNIPRVEPGHTMYLATGWNSCFFYTDAPIVCNEYKIWFSEDHRSANRATTHFKLYAGMSAVLSTYTKVEDVRLNRPYYDEYGSDSIAVEGSLGGITAQYFQIWVQGLDTGMRTDGPRVCGFQIT